MSEVKGRFILMIDSMVSGRVQREARAAMRVSITDVQPEQWYNLQDTMLRYEQAIVSGFGGPIGLKMAGTRVMPTIKKQTKELDAFTGPRELFEALDALYLANNRGPDAGHLKALEITDGLAVLEDTTPHLLELEWGVAEGIIKIFPGHFLTSSEVLERGEAKRAYKLTWKSR
jgi:hypothetical protein